MIDLKPACYRTATLVVGVADDHLTRPTASTEWTVRDLVDHLDEVSQGFTMLARPEGAEPAATDGDWRAGTAAHIRALAEAWDAPAAWEGRSREAKLDLSNARWGRIALTEMVVHGWELAQATGQSFALPEEATLFPCLEHLTTFLPKTPVPELWGPAVQVPVDAPLIDRVVAAAGRRP